MFSFFVPGQPRGKERPRHTKQGITYTPQKTKDYEEFVRYCFKRKYASVEPIAAKTPVMAFLIAYYKQPKNLTKVQRALILDGNVFPVVKPDGDNIAKAILDSLNNLAYKDDNQIVSLCVDKRYAVDDESVGVKVFITDYIEHPELFKVEEITGFEV